MQIMALVVPVAMMPGGFLVVVMADVELRRLGGDLVIDDLVGQIQERFGVGACRRYIVRFTRNSADIASVYALAELAGEGARGLEIDVIPLFETVEDLHGAATVLDGFPVALVAKSKLLQ